MKYNKEIYDRAESQLYEFRKKSQEDLEFRKSVLYRRVPEAEKIERELAFTALKAAKAVICGANVGEEVKCLRERNRKLQERLKEIIAKLNFPENYLELEYRCNRCKDKGFIDGKMCECMENLMKKEVYNDVNKLSPLSLSTFESFSLEYYSNIRRRENMPSAREHMSAIYRACVDYADNFSLKSSSIIMRGGTGLGKTHLSLAIANTVINNGFAVIYVSAPNMVSCLEKEKFKGIGSYSGSEEHFINCDLLIIDDLGSEFSTQFSNSAIYNIVNSRILSSKPTIISTNLDIAEIANIYTERMASRILGESAIYEFYGSDIRQEKSSRRRRGL